MHLIRFSLISLALSLSLFANEDILSQSRLDIFKLNKDQAKEDSSKLKKDWINSITYKYTKVYADDSKNDYQASVISVDQPIFKSGGIYKAIKYANSTFKYTNLSIDIEKKAMITEALNTLFQIDILRVQIAQQKLLLENAKIDVKIKKEQVLNGLLDTSYLNNAILDKNAKMNSLLDMEYNLEELINTFSNYSDENYESITRPNFSLIPKDEFISNNLNINKLKAQSESNYNYTGVILAKYLPTLNVTYNYTKYHELPSTISDDTTQSYGAYISMPLNLNAFNDTQSARIDYLKSKLDVVNKEIEETNFYKSTIAKIKTLDKKIVIAKDDEELYGSLLKDMIDLNKSGLKTDLDVATIKNSKDIKMLDKKVFALQKQVQLLKLYAKINYN